MIIPYYSPAFKYIKFTNWDIAFALTPTYFFFH